LPIVIGLAFLWLTGSLADKDVRKGRLADGQVSLCHLRR